PQRARLLLAELPQRVHGVGRVADPGHAGGVQRRRGAGGHAPAVRGRGQLAQHQARLPLPAPAARARRGAQPRAADPEVLDMTGRAHLVLVLLTMGMLAFVLHLVRSGRLRAKYALLWSTVGAGLVVLAAFPGLLDKASSAVGIYYPPAAFLT